MTDNNSIPLTRHQLREIDRRAIEEYGLPGVVLMENAGRNAAEIIARLHGIARSEEQTARPIAIVCGRGNNGGDGYVIARHLHNKGFDVRLLPAAPMESLSGDAAVHAHVIQSMGLPCHAFDTTGAIERNAIQLEHAGLIVDALLGTGFSGEVRAPFDAVIHAMNAAGRALRIAIDVPSGLDCDTGRPSAATFRADHTITFVAPKTGFSASFAVPLIGTLHVADIGIPARLLADVARSR